ncbi:sensor histidine kinase [Zhihengliuella salsuginis]|uniref:histidine kinase n=1 Tax=Zhihengliuella salsuginis TaxID=578222 RepID=A0ABQ3GHY5_9MICC|nr:HAMP domain-containing sensor histidine kinase [Zhihengliuella salsuginis]GHD04121.1 two-component sensor histidine kinase [Zhihengliuella salsuginis]
MTRRWVAQLRGASVRTRIMVALVALSGLTLAIAGTANYLVQRGDLHAQIDDSLQREVREFRALAQTGLNPDTGEAFTSADELTYLAIQRSSPEENEGVLVLQDGAVRWSAPEPVPVRLEADAELVRQLLARPETDRVEVSTVQTSTASYRAAVVPVQLADDPSPARLVLAFDLDQELGELHRNVGIWAAAGAIALAVSAAVSFGLLRTLLQPLHALRSTAAAISADDLDERLAVDGNDDLADLSETFNSMLDRLQDALASQRQLLKDVGHELRTPVAILQGHLELQDADDPDDVRQTQSLALDELSRMTLLIDDLSTLASADRDDFVQPRPTDVDALMADVLDKASGLGDRDWALVGSTSAKASLDPYRITQALLQLCQNAVKFSESGSAVVIGSEVAAEPAAAGGERRRTLRLWVRDAGIGIAEDDVESIFDRFSRGRNGSRAEGSGLGLTIVRAICEGHGGHITVASTRNVGTVFTLEVPI